MMTPEDLRDRIVTFRSTRLTLAVLSEP